MLVLLLACTGAPPDDTGADPVGSSSGTGEVTVTGADSFGTVGSAVWYRETTGDLTVDRLLVTTTPAACHKVLDYLAARDAFRMATEGIADADWCVQAKAPSLTFAQVQAALSPTGTRELNLSVATFLAESSLLTEGTFTSDGTEAQLFASAAWYGGDILAAYEQWDETSTREEGCGVPFDPEALVIAGVAGELVLSDLVDMDHVHGEVAGDLRQESDTIGSLTASFDAAWCE